MTLFAKQLQLHQTTLEILRSRGIAPGDDVLAFEFSVTQDVESRTGALLTAKQFYLQVAESLGIDTGLEDS